MVKRILVALSGTRYAESAIAHAMELAHRHGASVAGVTDVDIEKIAHVGPVPIGAGGAAHELAEHRRRETEERIEAAISRFKECCKAEKVEHVVYREYGEPFERLTSLWRYYDLTILGLQGLFEYDVLHRPDDMVIRLIASGVRPLLAVAAEHRTVETVLIAYSGSMESAKTMKRFVQMHLWRSLDLHLVCFEHEKDEAEQLLADAAAYCAAHHFKPKTHYMEGPAREGLLPFAEEIEADLLVMGATARKAIVRKLLGDTVLEAIRKASIPLFLAQ